MYLERCRSFASGAAVAGDSVLEATAVTGLVAALDR